jgi:hypothetical protein
MSPFDKDDFPDMDGQPILNAQASTGAQLYSTKVEDSHGCRMSREECDQGVAITTGHLGPRNIVLDVVVSSLPPFRPSSQALSRRFRNEFRSGSWPSLMRALQR